MYMLEKIHQSIIDVVDIINPNINIDIRIVNEQVIVQTSDYYILNLVKGIFSQHQFFKLTESQDNGIVISSIQSLSDEEFLNFHCNVLADATIEMADTVVNNRDLILNQQNNSAPLGIHDAIIESDFVGLADLLQDKTQLEIIFEDFTNLHGFFPLHTAAFMNSTEAISILVAAGADVNQECKKGEYSGLLPLHVAILDSNYEATKLLLDLGAAVTYRCDNKSYPDYSALMFARRIGSLDIIKLVLKYISKFF